MTANSYTRQATWHMGPILKQIDLFGIPVPAFSIKNEQKIATKTGGLATLITICIMLLYGVGKMRQVIQRENPLITQALVLDEFDATTQIDLLDYNFKLAFAVEGIFDQEFRDDPKYVHWYARLAGVYQGEDYSQYLSIHKCDEQDYEKFYPIISY